MTLSAGSGASTDRAAWGDALDRAARKSTGRALLDRLLGELCEELGATGAAVYLRDDGRLVREAAVGSGPFPSRLDPAAETGFHMLRLVALDGAELAIAGEVDPTAAADERLAVAFTAALRAHQLEKKLKRQRFEVAFRGVELEALYDVGLAVASTLDLETLCEEVLLRAISLLDARRGALYLDADGELALVRTLGGDARRRLAYDEPQVESLRRSQDPADRGAQDVLPGAGHLLAVAIEVDGRSRGLLVVGDKESRHGVGPFGSSDRRTLALFANQAAIALENAHLHRQAVEKERLEREAELAAEIQRRLLPERLPRLAGLEVLGWSRPARHVGGDFYDLMPLAGDRLAAVVADVAGKGMPAALLVSSLSSAMRLLVEGKALGPEVVSRLNDHVYGSSGPNKFITLLAAEIEAGSGEVRYLNAGHNPALHLTAAGEVRELASGGLPLGLFPAGSYRPGSIKMATGDLLCIYSDGITECASPEDEEFGPGRLVELLRSSARLPLPELVAAVDEATARFARGMPQADDQTLILIRKT